MPKSKQGHRWYFKFSAIASAYVLLFLILGYMPANDFWRNFWEGWAFIIFTPLVLLNLPLLIFNTLMLVILARNKVGKTALIVPIMFVIYHLFNSLAPGFLSLEILSSETIGFRVMGFITMIIALAASVYLRNHK